MLGIGMYAQKAGSKNKRLFVPYYGDAVEEKSKMTTLQLYGRIRV